MAVASCQILASDYRNGLARFRFYEQNLRVVVSEESALYDLGDEHPQFQRLVRGFVVQDKIELADFARLLDEEKPAQELLRYGEGGLPYFGGAYLHQSPLEDVGHLHGSREVRLCLYFAQRTEEVRDVSSPFHFFLGLLFLGASATKWS